MTSARDESQDGYVWYAAFGSNLCRTRFLAYLQGGVVEGSSKADGETGARDPSPPIGEDWRWFVHRLFFGHRSQRWHGGGVAFLDPEPGSGQIMSRLYKITRGQFEDLHQQEVRADTRARLDVEALLAAGALEVYDRLYGLALYLGAHADGAPIVTITTARAVTPNAPAPEYLGTVARGLREGSGMTDAEVTAYLAAAPGVADMYNTSQIMELLA